MGGRVADRMGEALGEVLERTWTAAQRAASCASDSSRNLFEIKATAWTDVVGPNSASVAPPSPPQPPSPLRRPKAAQLPAAAQACPELDPIDNGVPEQEDDGPPIMPQIPNSCERTFADLPRRLQRQ